jgi:hypothetical protein
MDLATEFVKQGLGFLIAGILAGVVVYLNNKIDRKEELINSLQEKRLTDANVFTQQFTSVAKDMVSTNKDLNNQNSILQKSVDQMATSLQQLLTTIGGKT